MAGVQGSDTSTCVDVAALSVSQIRSGIIARRFTAREVADAAYVAIAARDTDIHAFLELTPQLAYAAADKVDAALAAGETLPPLAGVPVAFKDNMNQVGTKTTCGSRMLANYDSLFTATVVERMVDAGALPLGKLNMDEFAFGSSTETSFFGPTHNPWDLERVPGGSSGGSAAAIAAGLATITLGSDTGGSIRQPASFCGIVGYKPTYGLVSRYGVVAFGSSLDQVGPFGKTVEDVALATNVLVGRDERDCTSQECAIDFTTYLHKGVKGMRIGVVTSMNDAPGVQPEMLVALHEAVENLKGLGAEVREVDLPHITMAMSAYYVIGPCEAFSNLSRFDSVRYGYREPGCDSLADQESLSRAVGFGEEAKRRILLGSYLLSSGPYEEYYMPAQKVRTLITQDFLRVFEDVDAIISPTSPRTAFKFGEISDPATMYLSDLFTIAINIAGNGGMSLPVGLGQDTGLPVSVQLIGPQFHDENIFQAAAALEGCYDIEHIAPLARCGAARPTDGAVPSAGASENPGDVMKGGE